MVRARADKWRAEEAAWEAAEADAEHESNMTRLEGLALRTVTGTR